MKYYIIPKRDVIIEIDESNSEEAMNVFAVQMDTDMNTYFVALTEEEYAEYQAEADSEANTRYIKSWMKDTVMNDFPVYDEDIADKIAERAYAIYCEGDVDLTQQESVKQAYDEAYDRKIVISEIQWIWNRDNVSDKLDELNTVEDTIRLFKLDPRTVYDAEGDDELILDLCVDALHHNRVTPEEVFDLPETVEVPSTLGDDLISEYIAEEYGFCFDDYKRSDDNQV